MTSENDGLTPTSMAETQNTLSPEFEKSAQGDNKNHDVEVVGDNMPDMVREDQLQIQYRPDIEGSREMDGEHFDNRWGNSIEKYAQHGKEPDAFDQVDQEKEWSERLGRDRGQERD